MSFYHTSLCMASITCGLFFNSSAYSICEKTMRCEIPETEYFITPVIFEPSRKTYLEFVEELLCFSKINLRPRRYIAFFVYRDSNHKHHKQIIGFSMPEPGTFSLQVSKDSKMVTKNTIPEGANILGSIHKDSSSNVYLGEVRNKIERYVMFDQMVGNMTLFSVNFNSRTQDLSLTSGSR